MNKYCEYCCLSNQKTLLIKIFGLYMINFESLGVKKYVVMMESITKVP